MRLCLVEDEAVGALEPLTLTRPAFDLILGSRTLGQKIARAFKVDWNSTRRGAMVRPHLVGSLRAEAPKAAINDLAWLTRGPVLVVNSRWVPPADFQAPVVRRPMVGLSGGQIACAWVGPGQAMGLGLHPVDSWLDEMGSGLDDLEVGGEWIERPWDLLEKNAEHLERDFAASKEGGRPLGIGTLIGPSDRLHVHPTARIAPDTLFDTTNGSIAIEAGAVVRGATRIEGPCSIGRDTHLNLASIRGGVTIGPACRFSGEIEQSIVHGHSVKDDESFLGRAYVGEWVSIGAFPPGSDEQKEHSSRGDARTFGRRLTDDGYFVGDHSRLKIEARGNPGTSIGPRAVEARREPLNLANIPI